MEEEDLKKQEAVREQVMSRRILSFKLWRESLDSDVLTTDELEKLKQAEEILVNRFEESELEPSVSTKLSDEEVKAIRFFESAFEKQTRTNSKANDQRKVTMVEASIDSAKPPKAADKKPKKKKKKDDLPPKPPPKIPRQEKPQASKNKNKKPKRNNKGDKVKKLKGDDKNGDAFHPSLTLQNLPKDHVKNKAKTYGSKSSNGSSQTRSGIKKWI